MAKKLNLEANEDFVLLGIVSSEKDYRLCYEINRWTGMDFKKDKDLELLSGKLKEPSQYSVYFFENDEDAQILYLVSNKGTNAMLVPEQKSMDYFMMIKGNLYDEDKLNLISKLRKLETIQGVYEVDAEKLKSKQNLIF